MPSAVDEHTTCKLLLEEEKNRLKAGALVVKLMTEPQQRNKDLWRR